MSLVSVVCCPVDVLIARPEESYRVCVSNVCDRIAP